MSCHFGIAPLQARTVRSFPWRAWLVATEVDLDSTYVGGAAAAIDALVADPAIEVVPARISDGISAATDTINPAPARPYR